MSVLLAPTPPAARRLAANVRLVPVSFVAAERGVGTDACLELLHAGILWPAFDLGVVRAGEGERGEYRIWRGALDRVAPWTNGLDRLVNEAIAEACLLPNTNTTIAGVVLEVTWQVSRNLLQDLKDAREIEAEVVGRKLLVNRASAAAFLKRRLL